MIEWMIAKRLMEAFPGSFVSRRGDFIVSKRMNVSFSLDCCDEREAQCRLLEGVSREAAAHQPFRTDAANRKYNDRMRAGINQFLGTHFNRGDMMLIHERIGDQQDRALTVRFIESGFNTGVLKAR